MELVAQPGTESGAELATSKMHADSHLRIGYAWVTQVRLGDTICVTQMSRLGDLGNNWIICKTQVNQPDKLRF